MVYKQQERASEMIFFTTPTPSWSVSLFSLDTHVSLFVDSSFISSSDGWGFDLFGWIFDVLPHGTREFREHGHDLPQIWIHAPPIAGMCINTKVHSSNTWKAYTLIWIKAISKSNPTPLISIMNARIRGWTNVRLSIAQIGGWTNVRLSIAKHKTNYNDLNHVFRYDFIEQR